MHTSISLARAQSCEFAPVGISKRATGYIFQSMRRGLQRARSFLHLSPVPVRLPHTGLGVVLCGATAHVREAEELPAAPGLAAAPPPAMADVTAIRPGGRALADVPAVALDVIHQDADAVVALRQQERPGEGDIARGACMPANDGSHVGQ